jgi:hypothetical protein
MSILVKFLPFEVKLFIDTTYRRRLLHNLSPIAWFSSKDSSQSQERALSIQTDDLTAVLKEYFDEYLQKEFNNANTQNLYAPFSHVSLSSIDRRRLQGADQKQEHDASFDIVTIRTGNVRKRHAEIYATYHNFDGVGVFTRDGDLPIPSSNYLQAKQLQAQADENGDLLLKMKNSGSETGLPAVTSVELGVVTISDARSPTDNGGTQQNGNYNTVIIIAVAVAACSMLLLGFALYLAFRRRTDPVPMVKTNEISPTTRETDQNGSPHSQSRRNPPVFEIKQSGLQHDDAISDYTESVYSMPTAVKSAKKAWLRHKSEESIVSKSTKVSNRFNPRYIISSKLSNASSSADEGDLLFDNNDVTGEMEGVPQMTSPMKKVLMGTKPEPSMSTTMDTTGDSTGTKAVPVPDTPAGLSESGLYPAEVIDDDITSSLSAYGAGISNHFKKMVDKDDGASVDSYESYGFSLDGADYSTVANSTKYGY